jgi:hypothetical protein
MRWYDHEPTLEEILSEPIFVALMKADRIDPHELQAMLKQVAALSRSVREIDTKRSYRLSAAMLGAWCDSRGRCGI